MAEFAEVMRQAQRMCKANKNCEGCVLYKAGTCYFDALPCDCEDMDSKSIENSILQWAAEHPEPRYPTWKEWAKSNFPGAMAHVIPCNFMSEDDWKKQSGMSCRGCGDCVNAPIPAEIAAKLGIKPIGGAQDE